VSDVLQAILADFQTLIEGLDHTVPGTTEPVPVLVRKGPKAERKVDPPCHYTVCKAPEPERKKKIAFGHMATAWVIEVTLVAPNAGDWAANLDSYTLYRQEVAGLFGPPYSTPLLPTAPGVFDLEILPDEFLPRDEMAGANLDRWTLKVRVHTTA
jgi:hypothetical protein